MKTDGDELSGSKALHTVACSDPFQKLFKWQIMGSDGVLMETTCSLASLWSLMAQWSVNIADKPLKHITISTGDLFLSVTRTD